MRYLLLSLFVFATFNSSIYAQEAKNNVPKAMTEPTYKWNVIYEQDIDSLTIQLLEFDNESSVTWQTKLINNKSKNELILDEDVKNKGIAWAHYELVGEKPKKMYEVVNAFISGKNLIVAYWIFR